MEELMIVVKPRKTGKVEWNREELTGMIDAVTAQYDGLVYTEDQLPEAKKDRANLNKALGVIEDERKRVKTEVMKPYEEFEAELKVLTGRIKGVIAQIDEQVKGYESQRKQAKYDELVKYYEDNIGALKELVPFEKAIFDQKMLNATVSLEKAKQQISERIERVGDDLRALDGMETEFKDAVKAYYYKTFDLGQTLQENARLQAVKRMEAQRQKDETQRQEAVLAEQIVQEEPEEVFEMFFTVKGTLSQLKALKAYMEMLGVEFK